MACCTAGCATAARDRCRLTTAPVNGWTQRTSCRVAHQRPPAPCLPAAFTRSATAWMVSAKHPLLRETQHEADCGQCDQGGEEEGAGCGRINAAVTRPNVRTPNDPRPQAPARPLPFHPHAPGWGAGQANRRPPMERGGAARPEGGVPTILHRSSDPRDAANRGGPFTLRRFSPERARHLRVRRDERPAD